MKKINAALLFALLLASSWMPFAAAFEQKIAEIKGESLGTFLSRLPTTMEFQIAIAVIVLGAVGVFFNYAVQWMKKQIEGNLWGYLFVDNVRGTLLSFVTTCGVGLAGITSGMFEMEDGTFIGWFRTFVLAFGNGYFWDAVLNKGTPKA